MQDANDENALLVDLVEDNMASLLGATVTRTNRIASPTDEQRVLGKLMKKRVQCREVASRLILVPTIARVDTDAVDVDLRALREPKARHVSAGGWRQP